MNKRIMIYLVFNFCLSASAWAMLECAIDLYKAPTSGQGQGAVIGGWAKGKPNPIIVTLKNAGISYTTMTDREGRWSLFFKLLSSRVTADVWSPETGENVMCSD